MTIAAGGTATGCSSCTARQVLQPYLRQPMLRDERKWDVRTYVLVTSVLPMRLYVFSEAIVRYAAVRPPDDLANPTDPRDLLGRLGHVLGPPAPPTDFVSAGLVRRDGGRQGRHAHEHLRRQAADGRRSWLKEPSARFETTGPSASLDRLKAQAAPT